MNNRSRSYLVFFAFLLLIPISYGSIFAFSCRPFNRTLPTGIFILIGFGLAALTAGSVIGAIFALFRLFATTSQGSQPIISANLGRYVIAGFGLVLTVFVVASKKLCS
ncbi:hypothetical protein HHL24_02160 [Paraburkholderia sp. RP-4-7]|uniref:Uncharacterized protein n=1 Tax=Paraburkholderia polaris TaxID=2728848 RepID=A0A848I5E6_9BURK|nr:hypothetical protein [Paraburkholderia polaris]NML96770.1 hypothetical protein [Paraburkholderia polaris]